jgi:hypothetical protein
MTNRLSWEHSAVTSEPFESGRAIRNRGKIRIRESNTMRETVMPTTRTWTGGTNDIFRPEAWTPAGRPQPGDTLIIGPGTALAPADAEATSRSLIDLTILLDDGPGPVGSPFLPTLSLSNTVIGHGTLIENRLPSPSFGASESEVIAVNRTVRNLGTIAENPGAPIGNTLNIDIGCHGNLINEGTISGTTISNLNIEGGIGSRLVNDGTISGQGTTMDVGVPVLGDGTFDMSRGANPGSNSGTAPTLEFHQSVDAAETIRVNDTTLILDVPLKFLATIDDLSVTPAGQFATDSSVVLKGRHATDLVFRNDVLTVRDGQQSIAHLRFSAGLNASDFLLTDTTAGSRIAIVAPAVGGAVNTPAQTSLPTGFPPLPDHL